MGKELRKAYIENLRYIQQLAETLENVGPDIMEEIPSVTLTCIQENWAKLRFALKEHHRLEQLVIVDLVSEIKL